MIALNSTVAQESCETRTERTEMTARLEEVERDSHQYRCPKCHGIMREISFSGIPVDRCASCNGIFFDSGEVETLIKKRTQRTLFHVLKEAI